PLEVFEHRLESGRAIDQQPDLVVGGRKLAQGAKLPDVVPEQLCTAFGLHRAYLGTALLWRGLSAGTNDDGWLQGSGACLERDFGQIAASRNCKENHRSHGPRQHDPPAHLTTHGRSPSQRKAPSLCRPAWGVSVG